MASDANVYDRQLKTSTRFNYSCRNTGYGSLLYYQDLIAQHQDERRTCYRFLTSLSPPSLFTGKFPCLVRSYVTAVFLLNDRSVGSVRYLMRFSLTYCFIQGREICVMLYKRCIHYILFVAGVTCTETVDSLIIMWPLSLLVLTDDITLKLPVPFEIR